MFNLKINKKSMIVGGSGTLIALLAFLALSVPGIIITTSGDLQCAGISTEPCVSYVNITNNGVPLKFASNISVISFNNSSGVNYTLERLVSGKWQAFDFGGKTLQKNQTWQLRLTGYKALNETVKWSVSAGDYSIDPTWTGYSVDDFFPTLVSNRADITSGYAEFQFRNPMSVQVPIDNSLFRVGLRGRYKSISVYMSQNYTENVPIVSTSCSKINFTSSNNSYSIDNCMDSVRGYSTVNRTRYVPVDRYSVQPGETVNFRVYATWDAGNGSASIEWVPSFNASGTAMTATKWAWWNTSWGKCINFTAAAPSPLPVNFSHTITVNNSVLPGLTPESIRFVNGTTCGFGGSYVYNYSMDSFNVNGNITTMTVKISDSNASTWLMYWNNPSANNVSEAEWNRSLLWRSLFDNSTRYPVGQVPSNGWSCYTDNAVALNYQDCNVTGSQAEITRVHENPTFELNNLSGRFTPPFSTGLNDFALNEPVGANGHNFTIRFNISWTGSWNNIDYFRLYNGTNLEANTKQIMGCSFQAAGIQCMNGSTSLVSVGVATDINSKYDVIFNVNMNNSVYTLYINGTQAGGTDPLRFANNQTARDIYFVSVQTAQSRKMFLDNITIRYSFNGTTTYMNGSQANYSFTNVSMLLNGTNSNKSYEYGSSMGVYANLTSGGSIVAGNICLDINQSGRGVNYFCNSTGIINISYVADAWLNYFNNETNSNYNFSAPSNISLIPCYQETANVPTPCGGLSTGNYEFLGTWYGQDRIYDGSWITSGVAYDFVTGVMIVNYTVPIGIQWDTAYWQVKDASNGYNAINFTIPASCQKSPLTLRINSSDLTGNSAGDCWNGTSWVSIYTHVGGNELYEEAMWWSFYPRFYIRLHKYYEPLNSTIELSGNFTNVTVSVNSTVIFNASSSNGLCLTPNGLWTNKSTSGLDFIEFNYSNGGINTFYLPAINLTALNASFNITYLAPSSGWGAYTPSNSGYSTSNVCNISAAYDSDNSTFSWGSGGGDSNTGYFWQKSVPIPSTASLVKQANISILYVMPNVYGGNSITVYNFTGSKWDTIGTLSITPIPAWQNFTVVNASDYVRDNQPFKFSFGGFEGACNSCDNQNCARFYNSYVAFNFSANATVLNVYIGNTKIYNDSNFSSSVVLDNLTAVNNYSSRGNLTAVRQMPIQIYSSQTSTIRVSSLNLTYSPVIPIPQVAISLFLSRNPPGFQYIPVTIGGAALANSRCTPQHILQGLRQHILPRSLRRLFL